MLWYEHHAVRRVVRAHPNFNPAWYGSEELVEGPKRDRQHLKYARLVLLLTYYPTQAERTAGTGEQLALVRWLAPHPYVDDMMYVLAAFRAELLR